MKRREFLVTLAAVPVAVVGAGCGRGSDSSLDVAPVKASAGFKSFGFYQGLGASEERSSSRTDGTYYNMPCISEADVAEGVARDYEFWHSHSSTHTFTLTEEHFFELSMGRPIEVYTSVVDGHRHALKVAPAESCEA